MERAGRKSESLMYGYEQMELLRILIGKEHCTSDMIHNLTGVPRGNMTRICKQLNIQMSGHGKGLFGADGGRGGGKVAAINRARSVSILGEKYKEEISRLFGKGKDVNTTLD